MFTLEEVKTTAKVELRREKFREAVEKEKERLRYKKSLWERIFPWKIIIKRR